MADQIDNPLNQNDIAHLKANLTGEAGNYTCADKKIFDGVMERHSVTPDELKRVQSARDEAIQMVSGATAEKGMEDMQADNNLTKVTSTASFGADQISATFTRSRDVPVQDEAKKAQGIKTEKTYGILTPSYTAKGAKGSVQPLSDAKKHYAQKAREIFGS